MESWLIVIDAINGSRLAKIRRVEPEAWPHEHQLERPDPQAQRLEGRRDLLLIDASKAM